MSLDSIMQVLWGGEISSLALIVTLLPLICQSLGDRYYLGENLSKYILNKKVVLKHILIVGMILNSIVTILVLVPTFCSVPNIFKNILLILSIVLLVVFFVYLFRKALDVIIYLNNEEKIEGEIKHSISDELKKLDQLFHETLINNGKDKKNPIVKKCKEKIEAKAYQWFKYSHKDYYDAKDTISFMVEMINDNKTINFLINNTIKDYISEIYKHGQMSIEDITNLLILWNKGCNTDCFRSKNVDFSKSIPLAISNKIIEKIYSKEENNIAYGNSKEFQELIVMLTYSAFWVKNQDRYSAIVETKSALNDVLPNMNQVTL